MLTREMKITNTEFGAGNVYGEKDLASAREILDVTVASVFRAAGNRSSTLFADLSLEVIGGAACVSIGWLRRLGNYAVQGIGCDEFSLSFVPGS